MFFEVVSLTNPPAATMVDVESLISFLAHDADDCGKKGSLTLDFQRTGRRIMLLHEISA